MAHFVSVIAYMIGKREPTITCETNRHENYYQYTLVFVYGCETFVFPFLITMAVEYRELYLHSLCNVRLHVFKCEKVKQRGLSLNCYSVVRLTLTELTWNDVFLTRKTIRFKLFKILLIRTHVCKISILNFVSIIKCFVSGWMFYEREYGWMNNKRTLGVQQMPEIYFAVAGDEIFYFRVIFLTKCFFFKL